MITQGNQKKLLEVIDRTEKVRSLLHLQRALREELYEDCSFWIDEALQNGATRKEISWVLRHPTWHVEVEPASRN